MPTIPPAFLEADYYGGKNSWTNHLSEPSYFFVPLFYAPDSWWVYPGGHSQVQEINARTITRWMIKQSNGGMDKNALWKNSIHGAEDVSYVKANYRTQKVVLM